MRFSPAPLGPQDDPIDLLRPGRWLIEAGSSPPRAHDPAALLADQPLDAGFAASLATARVLRGELAPGLERRLACEGCALPELASLALHEILLNAAVHGNLGISSGRAAEWQDLAAREAAVAAALADPTYADRLVTLVVAWDAAHLTAFIADEGGGYAAPDPAQNPAPGTPSRRGAGRGLALARAVADVTVLAGGRCTRLRFSRPKNPD